MVHIFSICTIKLKQISQVGPMEFDYGRKMFVLSLDIKIIPDILKLRDRFKIKYEQKPWFGWITILYVKRSDILIIIH